MRALVIALVVLVSTSAQAAELHGRFRGSVRFLGSYINDQSVPPPPGIYTSLPINLSVTKKRSGYFINWGVGSFRMVKRGNELSLFSNRSPAVLEGVNCLYYTGTVLKKSGRLVSITQGLHYDCENGAEVLFLYKGVWR